MKSTPGGDGVRQVRQGQDGPDQLQRVLQHAQEEKVRRRRKVAILWNSFRPKSFRTNHKIKYTYLCIFTKATWYYLEQKNLEQKNAKQKNAKNRNIERKNAENWFYQNLHSYYPW
jgi:hypothetical protein